MPHDVNGKPLQVGDFVTVKCKITRIYEDHDYCNLGLKTVRFMPPYEDGTDLSLNTKQVELVEDV